MKSSKFREQKLEIIKSLFFSRKEGPDKRNRNPSNNKDTKDKNPLSDLQNTPKAPIDRSADPKVEAFRSKRPSPKEPDAKGERDKGKKPWSAKDWEKGTFLGSPGGEGGGGKRGRKNGTDRIKISRRRSEASNPTKSKSFRRKIWGQTRVWGTKRAKEIEAFFYFSNYPR